MFLSIVEGVFGYYCTGQIVAVCHRWHSVDGSGLPSSSGKAGWGVLPGLAASQSLGPPCCSPGPHRQLRELLPTVPQTAGSKGVAGAKPGRGPGTSLGHGPGTAMWVPTAPAPHGMRVVKIERIACTKGGLRGKISAHKVKESCFNWEGKGRERNVKTTQTFLSLQGCRSPAHSSGGKTAPLERDLNN